MEPDKRFAIKEFLAIYWVDDDPGFQGILNMIYWAHKLRRYGGYDAPV